MNIPLKQIKIIEEITKMPFTSMLYDPNIPAEKRYHCTPRRVEIRDGRIISLDISGLGLNYIQDDISEFKDLAELNVGYNNLIELNDPILRLSNLRKIQAEGNRLRSLPNEIGLLNSLESLFLANNCIGKIPRSLLKLRNLKRIDLSGNIMDCEEYHFIDLLRSMNISVSR